MKVLAAFFKYDYGIKARGASLERDVFIPSMTSAGADVVPFWLEDNGYPDNIDELQKKLICCADDIKPDIIFFIMMGDEIKNDTLKKLSEKYITVNWFCDDQWRFDNYTKYKAPFLRYSITVDKYSIAKYHAIEFKNVILSQWAAANYIKRVDFEKIRYMYDVSFVGSKNLTREWYIYELKKQGVDVVCFGAGWDNGRISMDEMKKIFLNSKINLNLSNSVPTDYRYRRFLIKKCITMACSLKTYVQISEFKKFIRVCYYFLFPYKSQKSVEQIKARNFEIPGFGGFELTQYALQLEDYYLIGSEIAVFSGLDDMIRQVQYYLVETVKRKKICNAGYLRTREYSYKTRFKHIFKEICR